MAEGATARGIAPAEPSVVVTRAEIVRIRKKVAMISEIQFAFASRIAGPVQKQASLRPGSWVAPQCGR